MVPKVQPGQTLSISSSAKKKKKSPSNTLHRTPPPPGLVVIYMVLTLTATECVDSYNHVQMCDPTKKTSANCFPTNKQTKKPKVGGNPFCLLHLNHILAMSSKFSPRQSHTVSLLISAARLGTRLFFFAFIPTDHSLRLAS